MKEVMVRILPQRCEKIANGEVTFEVLRTRPKIETPFKSYIYCPHPKGRYDFGLCKNEGKIDLITKCNYPYAELHKIPLLSGKVIGEFVCDEIKKYVFPSTGEGIDKQYIIQRFNDGIEEFDYTVLVAEEGKDSSNNCKLCQESGKSFEEIQKWIGTTKADKTFFGWHISEMNIYEKPKNVWDYIRPEGEAIEQLDEDLCNYCRDTGYGEHKAMMTPTGYYFCEGSYCGNAYENYLENNDFILKRGPRSWCYVKAI